jgi:putative membrane protein insertion efficiency factor
MSPNPVIRHLSNLAAFLIRTLIHAYQALLSPLFYGSCRFYPSCSHFAEEAVQIHGPVKGAWMALGRLLRCQPFCKGGFDPVPPAKSAASTPNFSSHAGHPALQE